MNIDQNDLGLDFLEQLIGDAKGIIIGGHKNPPLKVDDGIGYIVFAAFINAPARHASRIICRAQEPACEAFIAVGTLEVVDDLALVPDVIAGGEHIDSQLEQILRQRRGDAEAGGSVFSVGDDEVAAVLFDQLGEVLFDYGSAGAAEDIADEENAHGQAFCFDGNTRDNIRTSQGLRDLGTSSVPLCGQEP